MNKPSNQQYSGLLNNIGEIIEQGKREAYAKLSNIIIKSYWEIGKKKLLNLNKKAKNAPNMEKDF